MGLDTVELIMEVEEAFGISIPDADAATLATVGDLHGYVVMASNTAGRLVTADEAWTRLSDILEHSYAIRRSKIKPSARIASDLGLD